VGNVEVFQALLKKLPKDRVVTDKDREDRTLLYYAVGCSNVEVVKELVAKGAKIDEIDLYGKTPVRYAIDVGNVKVFQALLENIPEEKVFSIVNQKDRDGTTLLHYAVGNGKAEVVKELLAKGAKVDEKDIYGKTPLQYAIEAGNVPVCMQLIDREAKFISEEDKVFGASLLKNAIKDNNYDVAIKLLEAGAKVDQKDEYGKTPLHYAAEAGNIVLCAKILEGYSDDVAAKVLTEGKKGERPLDILARKASPENKEELTKIAKHIGGILRESYHVLKNKTGLWQKLADIFQSFCKEIRIKTDREKVKEILGVGKGKKVTVAAFRSALEKLSKKTSAAYTKPSAGAEKGNAAQR
jgi:ankyrin repeat protein